MDKIQLRTRINSLMDAATALRDAASRNGLPMDFQGRLMQLEEEVWIRLKADLASYYEGKL